MNATTSATQAASLIADPSRSAILWSLMGGESRPASELAMISNISPQTASNHLRLLLDAGFLKVEPIGRKRFYKLGNSAVGVALESLAAVASGKKTNGIAQQSAPELVFARTCYDHLAGELGVAVLNHLGARKLLVESGRDYRLSRSGEQFFEGLCIDCSAISGRRRRFAYACLDWSQRVPHLGGGLGAALLEWMLRWKIIAGRRGSRAVRVTDSGQKTLNEIFGIRLNRLGTSLV